MFGSDHACRLPPAIADALRAGPDRPAPAENPPTPVDTSWTARDFSAYVPPVVIMTPPGDETPQSTEYRFTMPFQRGTFVDLPVMSLVEGENIADLSMTRQSLAERSPGRPQVSYKFAAARATLPITAGDLVEISADWLGGASLVRITEAFDDGGDLTFFTAEECVDEGIRLDSLECSGG